MALEHMRIATAQSSYAQPSPLQQASAFLKANPKCALCSARATQIVTRPDNGQHAALCRTHADELSPVPGQTPRSRLASMAARLGITR